MESDQDKFAKQHHVRETLENYNDIFELSSNIIKRMPTLATFEKQTTETSQIENHQIKSLEEIRELIREAIQNYYNIGKNFKSFNVDFSMLINYLTPIPDQIEASNELGAGDLQKLARNFLSQTKNSIRPHLEEWDEINKMAGINVNELFKKITHIGGTEELKQFLIEIKNFQEKAEKEEQIHKNEVEKIEKVISQKREEEIEHSSVLEGLKYEQSAVQGHISRMDSQISHLDSLIKQNESKKSEATSDYINDLSNQAKVFQSNSKSFLSSLSNELHQIKADSNGRDSNLNYEKDKYFKRMEDEPVNTKKYSVHTDSYFWGLWRSTSYSSYTVTNQSRVTYEDNVRMCQKGIEENMKNREAQERIAKNTFNMISEANSKSNDDIARVLKSNAQSIQQQIGELISVYKDHLQKLEQHKNVLTQEMARIVSGIERARGNLKKAQDECKEQREKKQKEDEKFMKFLKENEDNIKKKQEEIQQVLGQTGHKNEIVFLEYIESLLTFCKILGEFNKNLTPISTMLQIFYKKIDEALNSTPDDINASTDTVKNDIGKKFLVELAKTIFPKNTQFHSNIEEAVALETLQDFKNYTIDDIDEFFPELNKLQKMTFKKKFIDDLDNLVKNFKEIYFPKQIKRYSFQKTIIDLIHTLNGRKIEKVL